MPGALFTAHSTLLCIGPRPFIIYLFIISDRSMSDYSAKIERCQKANEQLRREANVNRIPVSEAIKL